MEKQIKWILTLLMVFIVQLTVAQETKTITGTVVDQAGLPLPGVNIIVQGTQTGTLTDFDGNYSINVTSQNTLVFSLIGFTRREIPVGNQEVINVVLTPDEAQLDEVIVTGQGSGIERRRLSTTVDVITEEDIDRLPATQIDQILQSNAPSAQIRLSSGQPGTASIIRTRGAISAASSSTPVIIVDGVRVDNLNSNASLGLATGGANVSALADIPVESIEKIEYIKGGAATTLYGADAANGVIQIITKKGRDGVARIFYESRVGIIKATDDYLFFERTGEAIFETGLSIEHRLGLNGGSDKFTYNFGGSLYQDDSFNDLNKQVKRSLTFGMGAQVVEKLRYQGSFSYTGFESNLDYNANTSFSRFSNLEGGARGNLAEMTQEEWEVEKDRARRIGELVDITRTINRLTASNKFIYDFTHNFQANATVGTDYRTSVDQDVTTNAVQIALGSLAAGTTDQAVLARALRSNFIVTGDLNFTHKAFLGDSFSFVTIVGGQFFRTTDRQNRIDGSGGVDGTRSINNFSTRTASDFVLENANFGAYFLENFGIYNVAFLEFGGRFDKNTSAGDETGILFLPKVGFTYNLSDHQFYIDSPVYNVVSRIKFRANYGEATNFAQPFSQDRTFALESFLGQPAFRFANPGNANLVSERVKTYEAGVELGFFNNRLNFSGTRYDATTEDALFTPGAPPSGGQLNQIQNVGEISNKGWEFEVNGDVIQNEDHNLKFSVSYNTNENVVTSTGGGAPFVVGGFTVIGSWVEQGQSLGYLRGTAAVRQPDGTFTFEPNTDLGDTFATRFGSMSLSYSFRNFSLFATGDYQYGGKIVDLSFLLRHIRGTDDTGIPEELIGTTSPFNYVNYFTYDNDFFKIRNIGASYRFGEIRPFSDITLGLSVSNPFNWSAGNFDPEITGSGISAQGGFASGGFAYGTESSPRIFMTSLRFQF